MGEQHMNGLEQHHAEAPSTVTVPLVTITPPTVRLTGAQIWTAILSIPATVAMLASLGIFYIPAKQTDMTAITTIVQSLQKGQQDSVAAIQRLTEAVDNISSLVVKIPKPKNLSGAVKLR